MESHYTSCQVTCHHCGHEWIYMGILLASLKRSNKPVRVMCPRCHNRVKMDLKNAKGPGRIL